MSTGWICLMYHDVLADEPGPGADLFAVSRRTFGRQLDALRAAGYRGCSLAEVLRASPGRLAAITFDDGTSGQVLHALPELVARGMTATFFVTTSWVGRPGYATWAQLRTLREAGMEIGSHTRSHPFLSELAPGDLSRELRGSREELDAELGQRTMAIALPGGDAPRRALRHLLADAGYAVIATSRWGANAELGAGVPAWVRRCTIRGTDAPDAFQRILDGDALLSARQGVREALLRTIRRLLGPTRYAAWRRVVLGLESASTRPGEGQ